MLLTIAISVSLSLFLSAILLRNYERAMQKRLICMYKLLDLLVDRAQ